jgi:hypothetical protein
MIRTLFIARLSKWSFAALVFYLLIGARPALASPVTYTYTGGSLTGSCSPSCGAISGSFTVANAIGPNFSIGNEYNPPLTVTPLSFSITDGIHTLNQTDSTLYFNVDTDANGNIDYWAFEAVGNGITLSTCNGSNCGGQQDLSYSLAGDFWNYNAPGTWVTTTTPEPSSLLLLGTGLLGLGPFIRRHLMHA